MSAKELLIRYLLILDKLRKGPANFQEMDEYLTVQSDLQGYRFNVSKRQFQRDLDDIRSIFEIGVSYDFRRQVYSIDSDEQSEISNRRMEAFDTFRALKIGEPIRRVVHFEKRQPQGTEHLFGLLHAINSGTRIKFDYQKFSEEQPSVREVEPLGLKEFKNRWYLIAREVNETKVKTFALDRLSGLLLIQHHFEVPTDYDAEEQFRYCFGIIHPENAEPQQIVLSFDPEQGKYIKTLPIHSSQRIILDHQDELRIELFLHPTYDFVMELLSYGNKVKVLEPATLAKEIKEIYRRAIAHYR